MFVLSLENQEMLTALMNESEAQAETQDSIRFKYDCGSKCNGKCGGTCQAACKSSCTSLFF